MGTLLKVFFVPILAVIVAMGWAVDILMLNLREKGTCKICGEEEDMFWFWVCSPLLIISFIGMGICRLLERMGY